MLLESFLESTFPQDTLFNEENRVYLRFKEIDQETRIAKENHLCDLFLKNVVTHSEVRIESGRQPFIGEGWPTGTSKSNMFTKGDGDWDNTNYGKIERDKIILQSLDEPGTPDSVAEVKSRASANTAKSAGGNAVANKNQPQNQHGTRSSAKLNKDFRDVYHPPELDTIFKQVSPLSSSYKIIQKDIIDRIKRKGTESKVLAYNLNITFTEAADRLTILAKHAFRIGISNTKIPIYSFDLSRTDAHIHDHIRKYIRKMYSSPLK